MSNETSTNAPGGGILLPVNDVLVLYWLWLNNIGLPIRHYLPTLRHSWKLSSELNHSIKKNRINTGQDSCDVLKTW